MKYFKHKLIAIIIGFGLIGPGCSDFLEMEPINQTYGGAFWVSEDAAEQALAGAYSLLRTAVLDGQAFPRFFVYGELLGEFTDRKGYSNSVKFKDGSFWNPNMGEFKWDKYYKIIAQCNLILHEVEKLDENLFAGGLQGKEALMGEAYFLRAYTYFYMTRIWGGVPLVTEVTTTVKQVITDDGYILTIPRSTEEEVWEQCIKDLKIAESTLDYGSPENETWAVRANKGSVQALMTHVYLWLDMPKEAEVAANNVITKGGYSLMDYTDSIAVNEMWIGRSSEGVFELNIDFKEMESTTQGLAQATVYHPYLQNVEENGNIFFVKPETIEMYEESDLRLKRFFTNLSTPRPNVIKYASVVYEDEATFTNAHNNSNVLLMRLSGIILLRAEALAKLDRLGEARILLNSIRERAEATPYEGPDSELLHEIFLERARELVMESQTYYDRIRLDEWENVFWMNEQRKEFKGYYWGIATDFITNNPKLTQNPYWAMKQW